MALARGQVRGFGGLSISGSRSRISKRRLPEAIARCDIPSAVPSIRIGPISITR